MKKYSALFKRITDSPLAFSVLSNVLMLFAGCMLFRPFFEENDDLGMAMISEGVYGQRDYHLIYSNAVLGRIVTGLCSAVSGVRWFVVLEIVLACFAFVLFTYVLAHYHNGKIVALFIEIACLYEIYVSVQYTKIASFIGACALLSLFDWVNRRFLKNEETYYHFGIASDIAIPVISVLLIVFSVLLRESAFLIALVVSLITWIVGIASKKNVAVARKITVFLSVVIPVLAIVGIFRIIDDSSYSDEDWSYYRYYDEMRREMVDFHYDALDYTKYGNELFDLGVSENDAFMYITWQYADEKVINPELMGKIAHITQNRYVNIDFIKAFVANAYSTLWQLSPIIMLAILAVFLTLQKSRIISWSIVHLAAQSILFVGSLFYYQYSGRWNRRVVYASLIVMTIAILYSFIEYDESLFSQSRSKTNMKIYDISANAVVIFGILAVSLIGIRIGNEFDYQENLRQKENKNFSVLQMYMEEEKDKLFVSDTFTINDKYKYEVFGALEAGSLDNMVTCGSWMTGTPIEAGILNRFGYFDPFDALKNGENNVILVDNLYPDRKAAFLSEHGDGPRYVAEFVESVCGYNLYRIR